MNRSSIEKDDFERFRPYLTVLARGQLDQRVRAKVDASDIVQQTLLQAHRGAGDYRGVDEAQLAAWLRQILARTLMHEIRDLQREKRDVRRECHLEADLTSSSQRLECWLAADQTSPDVRAERNEQLYKLSAALESLPAEQRQAVLLHYLRGWKLAQIAVELGCSIPAVGGLLHRGLKALRTQLAEPDRRSD